MRAYSTPSGGVIFVADQIKRKTTKKSYHDFESDDLKVEKPRSRFLSFFRPRKEEEPVREVA